MSSKAGVRIGGWALIVGALAFMAVFSYLAGAFDYPDVLDGPAATVLPDLLATGSTGRTVWTIYAFLPLIWIPAGVGAHLALRRVHPGSGLLAAHFAVVAALAMMLGLMRWPTIHWRLAELYGLADPSQRVVLEAIFDGLNTYLGNYIGEFLGELAFSLFFLLVSWALFRTPGVPKVIAWIGLFTGASGLVGTFRNVSGAVGPIASVNNYLLPLWMIVLGVVFVRWRGEGEPEVGS
jgi:hypothetical protein